jgi:hypothetical protein
MMCGLERVNSLVLSLTLCAAAVVGLGIVFAPWWGLSGIAFAMAAGKLFTFWPIQAYEIRRVYRTAKLHAAPRATLSAA